MNYIWKILATAIRTSEIVIDTARVECHDGGRDIPTKVEAPFQTQPPSSVRSREMIKASVACLFEYKDWPHVSFIKDVPAYALKLKYVRMASNKRMA
jgi:hypothetical protein